MSPTTGTSVNGLCSPGKNESVKTYATRESDFTREGDDADDCRVSKKS